MPLSTVSSCMLNDDVENPDILHPIVLNDERLKCVHNFKCLGYIIIEHLKDKLDVVKHWLNGGTC